MSHDLVSSDFVTVKSTFNSIQSWFLAASEIGLVLLSYYYCLNPGKH